MGIHPVGPGDERQDEGEVLHAARDGADMGEELRRAHVVDDVARARHAARARLDPGDPAEVRGQPDAAPGVGSESRGDPPAATIAQAPPLDPPEVRSGSNGLLVRP